MVHANLRPRAAGRLAGLRPLGSTRPSGPGLSQEASGGSRGEWCTRTCGLVPQVAWRASARWREAALPAAGLCVVHRFATRTGVVPLGAAHTLSPDVRFGHPCPPLTRRCRRFALRAPLATYAVSRGWAAPRCVDECPGGRSNHPRHAAAAGRAAWRGYATSRLRASSETRECRGVLEARGVSRGNADGLPVWRCVFPQLALFDVARSPVLLSASHARTAQEAPGGSRGTPGRISSRVPCDVGLNREIVCRRLAWMAVWFSCPESPGFHPGLLGRATRPIPNSKDLQNDVRKRIPAAATRCLGTQRPQAAPRGRFTQRLGLVPRVALPASAGF
jgi:hypothetical protein